MELLEILFVITVFAGAVAVIAAVIYYRCIMCRLANAETISDLESAIEHVKNKSILSALLLLLLQTATGFIKDLLLFEGRYPDLYILRLFGGFPEPESIFGHLGIAGFGIWTMILIFFYRSITTSSQHRVIQALKSHKMIADMEEGSEIIVSGLRVTSRQLRSDEDV